MRASSLPTLAFLALAALSTSGCAQVAADQARPNSANGWVETRLFFGLGPADAVDADRADIVWRKFLDREVTPRFPDGLSVIDVYGQWRGPGEVAPRRLRSKMLVIDYPDSEANRARIEAVRIAWKKLTGSRSVMRVTEPSDVSF